MKKTKLFFIIISFFAFSCYSDLQDYNNSGEAYYMPDVDIFVVMGPESSSTIGSERFNTNTSENVWQYVLDTFTKTNDQSANYYLEQLQVAFYHSRIRLFYVRLDPGQVGLANMRNKSSYVLTDETGIVNKGIVYNESGPAKIFLAGDESPSVAYAGLGYLNFLGALILSKSGFSSKFWFTQVVVHELGHNFGLPHPFGNDGGPNTDSCQGADQGTTNRIMDYTNNPEVFIECERFIATLFAEENFGTKQIYNPTKRANNVELYIGDWNGSITVGQAAFVKEIPGSLIIEVD